MSTPNCSGPPRYSPNSRPYRATAESKPADADRDLNLSWIAVLARWRGAGDRDRRRFDGLRSCARAGPCADAAVPACDAERSGLVLYLVHSRYAAVVAAGLYL